MKAVRFTIHSKGESEEIAFANMRSLIYKLKEACEANEMKLVEAYFIGSAAVCKPTPTAYFEEDRLWKMRYCLEVSKDKHTYNEIYKTVNGVQVTSFKTVG